MQQVRKSKDSRSKAEEISNVSAISDWSCHALPRSDRRFPRTIQGFVARTAPLMEVPARLVGQQAGYPTLTVAALGLLLQEFYYPDNTEMRDEGLGQRVI